eukprot:548130_1
MAQQHYEQVEERGIPTDELESIMEVIKQLLKHANNASTEQSDILSLNDNVLVMLKSFGILCANYRKKQRDSELVEAFNYFNDKKSSMNKNDQQKVNNWLKFIEDALISKDFSKEIVPDSAAFLWVNNYEAAQKDILIENKEEKKSDNGIVQWQWRENNGKWVSYNKEISQKIEQLQNNQYYTYTFSGNNQTYKITKKSKSIAKQINISSNVSRNARRIVHHGSIINEIEYPEWWDMENIVYKTPKLVQLDLTTYTAEEVQINFNKTANNKKIIKIESVQNQMLYDKYWFERKILLKSFDGVVDKLNERTLYHGAGQEITMREIETGGFRKEFSNTALFGKGSYFARDASYSVNYCSNSNGIRKMFVCKVICGESAKGNKKYELSSWPKKQSDGLIYDSLVDNLSNPTIFVIHKDSRVYPMFIIHFN